MSPSATADTGATTGSGSNPAADAAPPPSRPAPLGRPFGAQLASTGLANLGDGVLVTIAPLLALTLTASPVQISLLSAAAWLPWLLFGIAAGTLIDRVDRRRAQVVALAARAVLLAGGAVVAATGHLTMPVIVALILLYGVTEVVADLGATAIVPDLVPTDRLAAANGRVIGVQQIANSFLGAPLAGALVVIGAGWGLGAPAAFAALAALVLVFGFRGDFRRTDGGSVRGTRATLGQVAEGLRYLVHHPVLRPLVITSSVLNLASTAYFAVFVLWLVGPGSAVGLTSATYPLLMLGFALGAVAGSLLAERAQRRFGEIPTMVTTLTVNVLLMLVPVLVPDAWVIAGVLLVIGMLNTIGNVISQSLRQRIVPRHLLGRVGGAGRTLAYGLMPVGALLGGVVAETWSLPVTFVGAVVISVAACAYVAVTVRTRTVEEAERAVVSPG